MLIIRYSLTIIRHSQQIFHCMKTEKDLLKIPLPNNSRRLCQNAHAALQHTANGSYQLNTSVRKPT